MKRTKKRATEKAPWTRIRLRLPDLDQAKASVLSSLRSHVYAHYPKSGAAMSAVLKYHGGPDDPASSQR